MTNEEAKFVLEKNMSVFDIRLNCAYDVAIEALENADKYKWHDLRKNPDDLPKQDGYFLCKVESKNYFSYRTMLYMPCECKSYDMNKWIDRNVYVFNNFIIAWQEIELFEVEE